MGKDGIAPIQDFCPLPQDLEKKERKRGKKRGKSQIVTEFPNFREGSCLGKEREKIERD